MRLAVNEHHINHHPAAASGNTRHDGVAWTSPASSALENGVPHLEMGDGLIGSHLGGQPKIRCQMRAKNPRRIHHRGEDATPDSFIPMDS